MVTLRNRTRRVLSFNLEHEAMCQTGECRCQPFRLIVTDHNRKTGVKAKRAVEKTLCPSLTLLPLEVRPGLDDGVLACREVKAARKAGRIEVVEQGPAGPAAPAPGARSARVAPSTAPPDPVAAPAATPGPAAVVPTAAPAASPAPVPSNASETAMPAMKKEVAP
jgi:hypothetical protein